MKKKKTLLFLFLFGYSIAFAQKKPFNLQFISPKSEIEVYDFWEMSIQSKKPPIQNPFTDIKVTGVFTADNGTQTTIDGFCDAQNGILFKIRFMPTQMGKYAYLIVYDAGGKQERFEGSFKAIPSQRKGILRVDEGNPTHFVWEGTEEHFFWNSTTTYWLLGWKSEQTIQQAIDRLAGYEINRIRVAINARQDDGKRWNEVYVKESPEFTFKLNPWVAKNPESLDDPQFDVSRFNTDHWQKLDRLLLRAREKNIIVSLIFYVDGLDHGCDPFKKINMGNEDEQRYYRYAVARYAAYSNIMWDVTNEYHLFRNEAWVDKMGTLLKTIDPHKHLISVHGHSDFPFRKSSWVDLVLYQSWDECGGYDFITQNLKKQAETGRLMPQVNEEYGYEEHYATWGCGATAAKAPNGRAADNRVRLAWEMCMAGGYQTTGERADFGTGAGENTGGGWINGRGNDKMTMLKRYQTMKHIFEKTEYWHLQPHTEVVNYGNMCLAKIGQQYLVYSRLNHCRVSLPRGGIYSVLMINPRTGEQTILPDCDSTANGAWQYTKELNEDWVFMLNKQ